MIQSDSFKTFMLQRCKHTENNTNGAHISKFDMLIF